MDEPTVTLHDTSVSLDFETGDMEIRGRLTWDAGPHPEVVWVWAYFLNPQEAAVLGAAGSRSISPIKLLHPLRQGKSAEIVARGHFHWWNNPDVPHDGYLVKVVATAATSEDAVLPIRNRDYSTVDAIRVQVRSSSSSAPGHEGRRHQNPQVAYDVALSFAGEDRQYVAEVATLLQRAGVKVFYDKFEEVALWGRDLTTHLADIYFKRSRWVVLFISTHYEAKEWPNHELRHALARSVKEKRDSILPARFDDTELPGLVSTVAYVDLRTTSAERLSEMIVEKVRS